jgi:hypothetical protein
MSATIYESSQSSYQVSTSYGGNKGKYVSNGNSWGSMGGSIGATILGFLVIALVAAIILWCWKPDFICCFDGHPTDDVSACSLIIAAIGIAALIILLIGLVIWLVNAFYPSHGRKRRRC